MTGRTPGKSTMWPPAGGLLTNGTYLSRENKESDPDKAPVLRTFLKIAEYKGQVWVEAQNGQFTGQMLTFYRDQLYPINS